MSKLISKFLIITEKRLLKICLIRENLTIFNKNKMKLVDGSLEREDEHKR